ncbi:MAG: hypothetical protein WCA12_09450 [Burkholderiales bacterium]
MLVICEWVGSIAGLIGAVLLASNSRASPYGWLAFITANVAMIVFALGIDARGLLVQQLGFMATSCLGLYRGRVLARLYRRRVSDSCGPERDEGRGGQTNGTNQ